MKNFSWALLFLIGLGSVSAQSFNKHVSTLPGVVNISSGVDTLKILAVMVEFQEDKYDATIGTGKFGSHYSKAYGDTVLDPLPHDASYFGDHLLFAKNYFKKVSNGKLQIVYNVIPQVITVSKYMRDYSPGYNSNDLSPLGNFAQEVWNLADQNAGGIKFSDYNLFVIFHAGVSNGLDLGTFSIDRNLPSVYLGTTTLKKIFGSQFSGFTTRTGKITNSIILPETESREQELVDGSIYLNQVSINGGLVNNIGNYIGLPDLFNTDTGSSAIGRFGLMDAQSIGASYGLFPPEPSPWERMYLGWETPKIYSGNSSKINIAARATASITDTTLLKIPINSSEYFLVENRQQDALKNNVVLTIKKSGKIFTKTIFPDTSGYYNVTPDTIHGGVVIDVDEYDASMPGHGIVIWHIDENIINAKIAENRINADLDNRGIYVVEADGIQDIGHIYNTIFGLVPSDGTYLDFWYLGNKGKYFTNKFGVDTKPNTKSNSGASTYLALENFSSNSNKMSFNISYSGGTVKHFSLPLSNSAKTLTQLSNGTNNYLYITDNTNLYKYGTDGVKLFTYNSFSDFKPAAIYYNSTEVVVGAIGNKVNIYIKRGTEEFVRTIVPGNQAVTSGPVIAYNNGSPLLYISLYPGSMQTISLKDFLNSNFTGTDVITYITPNIIKQICAIDNQYAIMTDPKSIGSNGKFTSVPNTPLQISFSKNGSGIIYLIALTQDNTFYIFKDGNVLYTFKIASANSIKSFSLAQIDNSGENYIMVFDGNSLKAFNLQGKLIDGYPIVLGNKALSGIPLILDTDASKTFETISLNALGNLYFSNQKGELKILGEPVNVGSNGNTLLTIFNNAQSTFLASLDASNTLSIWNMFSPSVTLGWTNIYGDETNSSSLIASSTGTVATEYFPMNKAYNWPNPVYGNTTNIRYYVSENSTVSIKILDLSGGLVANLTDNAIGGVDNETVWNVSQVQSGIYYANLEVNGSSGKTANKIIKIAVIK